MAYFNPHITGYYNPLYNLNNQGFFIAQMILLSKLGNLGCSGSQIDKQKAPILGEIQIIAQKI